MMRRWAVRPATVQARLTWMPGVTSLPPLLLNRRSCFCGRGFCFHGRRFCSRGRRFCLAAGGSVLAAGGFAFATAARWDSPLFSGFLHPRKTRLIIDLMRYSYLIPTCNSSTKMILLPGLFFS